MELQSVDWSTSLRHGVVDRRGDMLESAPHGLQANGSKRHGRRLRGRAVWPLLCHAMGGLLPHPNLLFLGNFFPASSQCGLILSISRASPIARCLCERTMPGSFLVVVGGDFSKINRHWYFRSPGIPGSMPRGQMQLEPLGR